jgi:hypothetical protein
MMLLYATVVLAVLLAMASLAVDFGRVQVVKMELQRAVDACARYGASGIDDGTAVDKADSAGNDNMVDGTAVNLIAGDVVVGHWYVKASPQFSTSITPFNAVKVVGIRTKARNTAIPLMFASLIGFRSIDVHATSIATLGPKIPSGWIGLQGFAVQNNLFSASYDSAVDTSTNSSMISNAGMLGTNTTITAKNNEVAGLVVLGPGATSNLSLPSAPIQLPSPIPTPAIDFSGAPSSNPGGISTDLDVPATMTLPGGTYYFTSLTMENNSSLRFSGPATVYVDGNVTFNNSGEILAYDSIPANLHIIQRGAGTVFGGPNANNVTFIAAIDAPETDFIVNNGPSLQGRATFRSIQVKNNANFYYDESLRSAVPGYGNGITTVK